MKKSLTEKEIISALTHCKNEDCLKCFLYGEPKCITLCDITFTRKPQE